MSTIEMDKQVYDLVERARTITDQILELEKSAKQYHEESESEYHKNLFLILNNAYCDAGQTIARSTTEVTGAMIQMYTKIICGDK